MEGPNRPTTHERRRYYRLRNVCRKPITIAVTFALSLGLCVGVGLAPKSTGDGSMVDFEELPINYTAKVQMNQGTAPAYGTWIALFNPSTHTSAFIDYCGISGDAFQASLPGARSMLASMT